MTTDMNGNHQAPREVRLSRALRDAAGQLRHAVAMQKDVSLTSPLTLYLVNALHFVEVALSVLEEDGE